MTDCFLSNSKGNFFLSADVPLAWLKSLETAARLVRPAARCSQTADSMEGGDSEFANFTLPSLKAFFEARSHNVSGNKQ